MEDFDGVILFVVGCVVAVAIFFGVTTAIKKSLKPTDKPAFDSSDMQRDQKTHMEDLRRQQERAIRDQKQKIKDMQRLHR